MNTVTFDSGISLHYQDQGDKKAPAVILIMGLGCQLTVWPDEFYFGLVEKGYRVIRFDNRDVGLSSQLNNLGSPSIVKSWLSQKARIPSSAPYTLEDMAQDVLDLMAALGIKKAHLIGASMGGMIAQIIAAKHKKKVISLTSIMSSTGTPGLHKNLINIALQLAKHPNKPNRESAIQYNVKLNQLIGSPSYPIEKKALLKNAEYHVDRAHNPIGVKRQLVAITSSGCRKQLLPRIKAPTLVIHGSEDPVIPVSSGKETAKHIRKSKLKIIEGMGHDFPPVLMKKLVKWVSKHVDKAEIKLAEKKLKKKQKSMTVESLSKTESIALK